MVERFLARVISEGRITIPESVRKVLDVKEGDIVRASIAKAKKKDLEPQINQEDRL